MLSADNEGQGYSVDKQGGQLILNFNYEAAKSKLAMLKEDYNVFKSEGYSISEPVAEGMNSGEVHIGEAERYLLQAPAPDMKSAVAELNLALKDTSYAHEQLYLDRAEADIEKYRKGDGKIKVVDEKGTPLDDCGVTYKQTNHDFLFSVSSSQHDGQQEFIKLLKDAGINCMYTFFAYGEIQPEPGKFQFAAQDDLVNSKIKDGFKLIGCPGWFFYRAPWEASSRVCPSYLDNMSFDEIKDNIYKYMYTIADRYKGKVDDWEAIYEPGMPFMNAFNWTWNQKFEIYTSAVRAVKDANPKARIIFKGDENPSYAYFSSYKSDALDLDGKAEGIPSPELIPMMIERQIPIDIVGLHLINAGVDVYPGTPHVHLALDLVTISNLIDQYSKLGKPVFFREHQAPSTQVEGGNWWHRPWDEQTQAEYVKDFYTLAFSKPLMDGIGWSTGFTDDDAPKYGCISGGLLDADLKPKLSYFALKDLVDSWTTSGTGITNENGEFKFRGFAGDYEVTIETTEGQSFETTVHVNEQQTNEITIEFPTPPQVEQATTPVHEETLPSEKNNIPIIAGAVGGIIVVGLLALLLFRKKLVK
jgi:hypothetical protein